MPVLVALVAGPSLRLLPLRCSLHAGLRQLSKMTRSKAQGRRVEAAAEAAPTSEVAPPAAATPAPPKFSPALTAIDPSQYDSQLEAKEQRIRNLFAEFNPPPLQAFRSRPEHYRMR